MMYHTVENHADCAGVAVVDEAGEMESCHASMAAAKKHMADKGMDMRGSHGPVLTRTLAQADMQVRGDGRTVYGLVVPFDREARVNDGMGPYTEVFRHGAFARTINAGVRRVKFLGHHSRTTNPLGRAEMLREDAAGLVGEFRVSRTQAGDDALELVKDGALDAFSVGFAPVKHRGRSLVERLEVKLNEVSLVAFPAYEGATVAGVRAQLSEHLSDEELERLLALAQDLGTQNTEPAREGTSADDPPAAVDDSEFGHSSRNPTRAQRIARALATQEFQREPTDRDPVPAG